MATKRESRIYTRGRGGEKRYYGDFRAFADVGGKREPLAPKGSKRATTDASIAAKLFSDRIADLEAKRRGRTLHGVEREDGLKHYAAYHLRKKAQDRECTENWLTASQGHLQAAVDFFGADTDLAVITPADCVGYVEYLRKRDNGRSGTLTDASVRTYLNTLSNMFKRALAEGYTRLNPVQSMYSRPTAERREAPYLSAADAAILLEAARTYRPPLDPGGQAYVYPILATFLLTGGRKSEVFGLEVDDVSLRLKKIWFKPNQWRRLKTRSSERSVPLWPQLEEILREYLMERERKGGLGRLLFPGRSGEDEGECMIRDMRKALDHLAERAGFPEGTKIRLHQLRHTYTSARIQTCDRGAPVALFTVARELGHSSLAMIESVYGHLHDRVQAGDPEVVEYRTESHKEALRDRLKALKRLVAQEATKAKLEALKAQGVIPTINIDADPKNRDWLKRK